jgi:uncharacterized protein (TIGR02145 family)
MKKITFLFDKHLGYCALCLVSIFAQAQNYQITFAGTGASSKVDSVQVENLTQCRSISLNGSDILNLYANTGINEISNTKDNSLRIYPNPTTGYCLVNFEATAQGETTLGLYDIAGKKIVQVQEFLFIGQHTYKLSGLGSGIYVLKVESAQYSYSAKIVSCSAFSLSGNAEIKHIESLQTTNQNALVANEREPDNAEIKNIESLQTTNHNALVANEREPEGGQGEVKSLINMQYTKGDTLKLTGFSGIYSTVFMLVPTQSQTITFNFIRCTDADSNHYALVQIGTQIWMEENLKTTKYNDGSAIPLVADDTAWSNLSTPGYCWYNDSIKYKNIYGSLYNWYAVNTGKLCPTGWHVPTYAEWHTLITYLGGGGIAGGKMKESCSTHWYSPNTGTTNSSGLTFLPGGYRVYDDGTFGSLGGNGDWWSATEGSATGSWYCGLVYGDPDAYLNGDNKQYGFSVRCVKD